MFARRTLALAVSLAALAGCSGKAPGHETSRSRFHDLVVHNASDDEHVSVFVDHGAGRNAIGTIGDGSDGGIDWDALWDSDDDDTKYYWVVPGTWHVTLVGDSAIVDCGTLLIGPGPVVEVTYDPSAPNATPLASSTAGS